MNRHSRRRDQKLSRDAKPEEIFPDDRHAPIQNEVRDQMNSVMRALQGIFGDNYDLTLFVAERKVPSDQDRAPRFNYISTAAREDMLAVLSAFVDKNRAAGAKIDKINDAPPTERRQ